MINEGCKCEKVLEILKETRSSIKEEYSEHKIINADFVRTRKAMFFEKISSLFGEVKEKKEVN